MYDTKLTRIYAQAWMKLTVKEEIVQKSSEFCSFSLLCFPFFLIASRCFVVGENVHSPNIFSRRLHWNITLAPGSSNHNTPDSRYRCSTWLELCFLRDYFTPAVMIQTNAPPCWGAAICCDAGINVADIRNSFSNSLSGLKPLQANRKSRLTENMWSVTAIYMTSQ